MSTSNSLELKVEGVHQRDIGERRARINKLVIGKLGIKKKNAVEIRGRSLATAITCLSRIHQKSIKKGFKPH